MRHPSAGHYVPICESGTDADIAPVKAADDLPMNCSSSEATNSPSRETNERDHIERSVHFGHCSIDAERPFVALGEYHPLYDAAMRKRRGAPGFTLKIISKLLSRLSKSAPKTTGSPDPIQTTAVINNALDAAGLSRVSGPSVSVRATIDEALTGAGLMPGNAGAGGDVLPQALRTPKFIPSSSPRVFRARDVPDTVDFPTRSFSSAAGTRSYKLYVPKAVRDAAHGTVPLVLMLHGCTQSADDFAAGTSMNALADRHTFVVAYPIQPSNANGSKCWNWFRSSDQERGRGEPSLLAGIAEQIVSDLALDRKRVFVAGLSAGAAMAVILGQVRPDLFAAVGVHSGLPFRAAHDVPSAFAAMGGRTVASETRAGNFVPTIVFHGDADATVALSNGQAVVRLAVAAAGQPVKAETRRGAVPSGRTYERTVYRDGGGEGLVEYWQINGAPHAWAGGSSAGTYTDPSGPSASAEMVRFFLERKASI